MRQIDALLNEYGASHQNQLNKRIHWICVPAIYFSIVLMLWAIPPGPVLQPLRDMAGSAAPFINWGSLLITVTMLYYLRLSLGLFIGMILFSAICMSIAWWLEQANFAPLWLIGLLVFAAAWIGQFYGHKVEGKKPSFFKDLQFLLVGPAWLMHFLFKKAGIPY